MRTIVVGLRPALRLSGWVWTTGAKADTFRVSPNLWVTISTGTSRSLYLTTATVSGWFGTVSGFVSAPYETCLPSASQYCTPSAFSTRTCLRKRLVSICRCTLAMKLGVQSDGLSARMRRREVIVS